MAGLRLEAGAPDPILLVFQVAHLLSPEQRLGDGWELDQDDGLG